MVKRSSQKQKGIQRGVQRHRIGLGDNNDDTRPESIFSLKVTEKLGQFAAKQWRNTLEKTSRWLLIPVDLDKSTGVVTYAPLWKRLIHYSIMIIYAVIMIYKLIVALHRAFVVKLDVYLYLCACSFIVVFIPASCAIGQTCQPRQFCDLLNSWKPLLTRLERMTGKLVSLFDESSVSTKIIILYVITTVAAVNTAGYSLVADVPNCVLPTLKNAGLETSDVLPKIVWRLLCFPLELLTLWPPMLVTAICAMTMVMSLGTFNKFGSEARKRDIRNMGSWEEVYTMYRTMQVYNSVVMNWLKVIAVTLPVTACCGVILTLYVTIRPSDLPMLIYPCFPIVAILDMTIITGMELDAVVTKMIADQVASNLQTALYSPSMWRLGVIERKVFQRRLTSLRPISLKMGDFAEASYEVPMNVWDEVFSQLVILLSL